MELAVNPTQRVKQKTPKAKNAKGVVPLQGAKPGARRPKVVEPGLKQGKTWVEVVKTKLDAPPPPIPPGADLENPKVRDKYGLPRKPRSPPRPPLYPIPPPVPPKPVKPEWQVVGVPAVIAAPTSDPLDHLITEMESLVAAGDPHPAPVPEKEPRRVKRSSSTTSSSKTVARRDRRAKLKEARKKEVSVPLTAAAPKGAVTATGRVPQAALVPTGPTLHNASYADNAHQLVPQVQAVQPEASVALNKDGVRSVTDPKNVLSNPHAKAAAVRTVLTAHALGLLHSKHARSCLDLYGAGRTVAINDALNCGVANGMHMKVTVAQSMEDCADINRAVPGYLANFPAVKQPLGEFDSVLFNDVYHVDAQSIADLLTRLKGPAVAVWIGHRFDGKAGVFGDGVWFERGDGLIEAVADMESCSYVHPPRNEFCQNGQHGTLGWTVVRTHGTQCLTLFAVTPGLRPNPIREVVHTGEVCEMTAPNPSWWKDSLSALLPKQFAVASLGWCNSYDSGWVLRAAVERGLHALAGANLTQNTAGHLENHIGRAVIDSSLIVRLSRVNYPLAQRIREDTLRVGVKRVVHDLWLRSVTSGRITERAVLANEARNLKPVSPMPFIRVAAKVTAAAALLSVLALLKKLGLSRLLASAWNALKKVFSVASPGLLGVAAKAQQLSRCVRQCWLRLRPGFMTEAMAVAQGQAISRHVMLDGAAVSVYLLTMAHHAAAGAFYEEVIAHLIHNGWGSPMAARVRFLLWMFEMLPHAVMSRRPSTLFLNPNWLFVLSDVLLPKWARFITSTLHIVHNYAVGSRISFAAEMVKTSARCTPELLTTWNEQGVEAGFTHLFSRLRLWFPSWAPGAIQEFKKLYGDFNPLKFPIRMELFPGWMTTLGAGLMLLAGLWVWSVSIDLWNWKRRSWPSVSWETVKAHCHVVGAPVLEMQGIGEIDDWLVHSVPASTERPSVFDHKIKIDVKCDGNYAPGHGNDPGYFVCQSFAVPMNRGGHDDSNYRAIAFKRLGAAVPLPEGEDVLFDEHATDVITGSDRDDPAEKTVNFHWACLCDKVGDMLPRRFAEINWDAHLQQWLDHLPPAKRAEAETCVQRIRTEGIDALFDRMFKGVEINQKMDEVLLKIDKAEDGSEKVAFVPRPIHNVKMLFQALCQPAIFEASRRTKTTVWAGKTAYRVGPYDFYPFNASGASDLELTAWANWAMQLPPSSIAAAVAGDDTCSIIIKADGEVIVETDFNFYDGTQRDGALTYQNCVFDQLGVPEGVLVALDRMSAAPLKVKSKRTNLMITIDRSHHRRRQTGGPETTLGNSTNTIGASTHVFGSAADFSPEEIQRRFLDLGLKAKVKVHTDLEDATFLKGWWVRLSQPVRVSDLRVSSPAAVEFMTRTDSSVRFTAGDLEGSLFRWMPLPSKILKMGKSLVNPMIIYKVTTPVEAARRYLHDQAVSCDGLADAPFFRAFRSAHLNSLLPAVPREHMDTMGDRYHTTVSANWPAVDFASYEGRACKRYDCTPQSLWEAERMLADSTALSIVAHPVWLHMARADYN